MRTPRAFTLIELLVVITIIVVLLALLAPALDKAVYQAQLATCGANLKGIVTGVQTYAMSYNRQYPHRPKYETEPALEVSKIVTPQGGVPTDERPVLREAFPLDMLEDPLCKSPLDFDEPLALQTHVFANYNLYFGVRWTGNQAGPSMMKVGDRFGWAKREYSLLAGDTDMINDAASPSRASGNHPDADGKLAHEWKQNADWAPYGTVTASTWAANNHVRGTVDKNFAYSDGSVRRVNAVRWNEGNDEDRMVRLPHFANGLNWKKTPLTAQWQNVPRE